MNLFTLLKPLIHLFPPETAHNIAISLLHHNLLPGKKDFSDKMLESNIASMDFKNPIGLAAGFDKNAQTLNNLQKFNFGFIETGTVTPLPQPGNPKPRLFRLDKEQGIINRMGFNNAGKEIFRHNFLKASKTTNIPFGINIGKNKNTKSDTDDYIELLKYFYDISDYITINISSPNTPNLRNIQKKDILKSFLKTIKTESTKLKKQTSKTTPIFLKISPDLIDNQLQDICDLSIKYNIDALIISNTTIARPGKINHPESGGLSGKPLFNLSNKILSEIYIHTKGTIPLIGVGGISNAQEAYHKICSGASLIQIYSALIYQGFGLVTKINQELIPLLKQDGFNNITEAIGSNH